MIEQPNFSFWISLKQRFHLYIQSQKLNRANTDQKFSEFMTSDRMDLWRSFCQYNLDITSTVLAIWATLYLLWSLLTISYDGTYLMNSINNFILLIGCSLIVYLVSGSVTDLNDFLSLYVSNIMDRLTSLCQSNIYGYCLLLRMLDSALYCGLIFIVANQIIACF